ncbi:hypothetical protein SLS53_008053 [Cytospora paraplurivora]|uniref:B3/B4 tRNA-binding domain-containing protein n=1 Tax=Cytospora paraplurivora TaxID=2898453 RepID=A0AAN9YD44_9PEZI
MARFSISTEVADLLPHMQVVVVTARGLDNRTANPKVAARVQAVVDKTLATFTANNYSNAQSHPRVALYRDTLKKAANVSAKKFPQSNESLLKRLLKDKKPSRPISPVVDFYNSVSIEHAVTAGAFDLSELGAKEAPLELRVGNEKDRFVPLDAPDSEPAKVDSKEILYVQDNVVLTRHLAWRQSAQALVTENSTDVMFMSEVFNEGNVGSEPTELTRSVAQSLQDGLKELFGVDGQVTVLGKSVGKLEVDL